jgi:hypothetical protein
MEIKDSSFIKHTLINIIKKSVTSDINSSEMIFRNVMIIIFKNIFLFLKKLLLTSKYQNNKKNCKKRF